MTGDNGGMLLVDVGIGRRTLQSSAPSASRVRGSEAVTFRVLFSPTAGRDLQRIPPRIVSAIIEFVFGDLAAKPQQVGKPLDRELTGSVSARRGPYRVLCDVDDQAALIIILRVGHRADVYRPR